MLQLHSLTTGYAHRVVSQGLTAHLPAASLTALVGKNGAGKSTLLQTLMQRLRPLSGTVIVQGEELSQLTPKRLAQTISVVLTQRVASAYITVRELVALGRTPYTSFSGKLTPADHAIVEQALTSLSLQPLAHRAIHTLSDGEAQRAMIAKALVQQTPIILLDEPTAYLDYPSKVAMFMQLRRLAHREGKTILLSTHDLELALRLCDRIWMLSPESGLLEGTPADFAENKLLDKHFSSDLLQFSTQQILNYSPLTPQA